MTELPSLIAPIDVAVIDPDLLWRVEHMNLLRSIVVRDFAAPEEALAALTPDHDAVLVIGPNAVESFHELATIAGARHDRPEFRVLVCIDVHDGSELPGPDAAAADVVLRAEVSDDHFARAVLDLLARPRVLAKPPAARASRTSRPATAPRDVPAVPPIRVSGSVVGPRTVERLQPRHNALVPPRLAIITSAKGGEGVSTVALNLANAIVIETGTRTAIVDGEPLFGDIRFDAGEAAKPSPVVFELPIADAIADELVDRPTDSGPFLVRFPAVEGELADRPADVLRDVLALAGQRADVVIADVPWDLLVASGLVAQASLVALVTTRRAASIKNAVIAVRELGPAGNVGLIINETDRRQRTTSIEDIVRNVGIPLVGHLPYSAALHRAAGHLPPNEIAEAQSRYGRAMTNVLGAVAKHFPVLV